MAYIDGTPLSFFKELAEEHNARMTELVKDYQLKDFGIKEGDIMACIGELKFAELDGRSCGYDNTLQIKGLFLLTKDSQVDLFQDVEESKKERIFNSIKKRGFAVTENEMTSLDICPEGDSAKLFSNFSSYTTSEPINLIVRRKRNFEIEFEDELEDFICTFKTGNISCKYEKALPDWFVSVTNDLTKLSYYEEFAMHHFAGE